MTSLHVYLREILRHWVLLITSSFMAAVLGIWNALGGPPLARYLALVMVFACIFVAGYRAWKEKHEKVEWLTDWDRMASVIGDILRTANDWYGRGVESKTDAEKDQWCRNYQVWIQEVRRKVECEISVNEATLIFQIGDATKMPPIAGLPPWGAFAETCLLESPHGCTQGSSQTIRSKLQSRFVMPAAMAGVARKALWRRSAALGRSRNECDASSEFPVRQRSPRANPPARITTCYSPDGPLVVGNPGEATLVSPRLARYSARMATDKSNVPIYNRPIPTAYGCLLVLILACVASWLLPKPPGGNGPRDADDEGARSTLSHCWLAVSAEAHSRYLDLALAKDFIGLAQMESAGLIFEVPASTHVLVISRGGLGVREVRIMDERQLFGRSGFVTKETLH